METQPRQLTIDVQLGEQTVTLTRLGTRNALAVAQTIVRYVKQMREGINTMVKASQDPEDREARAEAGMAFIETLADVLEEDELLRLLSRLLGVDIETVGDAPLEDTLDAVAAAFEINDMSALLSAGQRILGTIGKATGAATGAIEANANRAQRRASTRAVAAGVDKPRA